MGWFLRRVVGSARFTFGLETVTDISIHQQVGRPMSLWLVTTGREILSSWSMFS